jgi:uncharacterized membrane protein YkgB
MIRSMKMRLENWEQGYAEWASTHGVAILRVTLGLIFVWFGVLKFCPGLCDVEVLAGKTIHVLTLGLLPLKIGIWLLGFVECLIGVGLISGQAMRLTLFALMLHLAGTFLPMAIYPGETWKHFPYAPTLVGQYILKNLILLAAGVVVAGRVFGRATVLQMVPVRARRIAPARTLIRVN